MKKVKKPAKPQKAKTIAKKKTKKEVTKEVIDNKSLIANNPTRATNEWQSPPHAPGELYGIGTPPEIGRVGCGIILHDFLKNTIIPERKKSPEEIQQDRLSPPPPKKSQKEIQQERLKIIIDDIIHLISEDKPIEPLLLKEYLINSLKNISENKGKVGAFYPTRSQQKNHWLRDLEIAKRIQEIMESKPKGSLEKSIPYEKARLIAAGEFGGSEDSQIKRAYEENIDSIRDWDKFRHEE